MEVEKMESNHKMRFFRWFDLVEIYVHPSPTSEDSTKLDGLNHTHTHTLWRSILQTLVHTHQRNTHPRKQIFLDLSQIPNKNKTLKHQKHDDKTPKNKN